MIIASVHERCETVSADEHDMLEFWYESAVDLSVRRTWYTWATRMLHGCRAYQAI